MGKSRKISKSKSKSKPKPNPVEILVTKIVNLQYRLNEEVAVKIWGNDVGPHLFNKFRNSYDDNLLELITALDPNNKSLLYKYLVE